MWKLWELPKMCEIDGIEYGINTDYRDILEILSIIESKEIDERIKVQAVLQIFYAEDVPDVKKALDVLMLFINCGEETEDKIPQPKQIDWEQDYLPIVADINKSAGLEIRSLPYLHWFTFISYFGSIGEGQLSNLVGIREKLRKGQSLEKHEYEFYALNKSKVKFQEKYTREEQSEFDELLKILDG